MGGLSFFLNIAILLVGGIMRFLKKRGFMLHGAHAFFSLFIARRFDNPARHFVGYSIMFGIFFFLFLSTSIAFVNRMKAETNVSMIQHEISTLYPEFDRAHMENIGPNNSL